ncbi:MAG: type II toxin-antitoxin system VapC family toxin [Neorhizobium sp.]|nr:type II toxin-antitoxin system VapC family toxin [Neorhizobium sp.]
MIVDTNVLVRVWAADDPVQSAAAEHRLRQAKQIYIANSSLCEFVWVARKVYRQTRADIAAAIQLLTSDPRVVIDLPAVTAGLEFLGAGGDFADGVIEFEGRKLGGEIFVTFDRHAAAIVSAQGRQCDLLASDPA